jgi:hypothetical protein
VLPAAPPLAPPSALAGVPLAPPSALALLPPAPALVASASDTDVPALPAALELDGADGSEPEQAMSDAASSQYRAMRAELRRDTLLRKARFSTPGG